MYPPRWLSLFAPGVIREVFGAAVNWGVLMVQQRIPEMPTWLGVWLALKMATAAKRTKQLNLDALNVCNATHVAS